MRSGYLTLDDLSSDFPPQVFRFGASQIKQALGFVKTQSSFPGVIAKHAVQELDRPGYTRATGEPVRERFLRWFAFRFERGPEDRIVRQRRDGIESCSFEQKWQRAGASA